MHISRPAITIIVILSIAIGGFAVGSLAGAYILGEPGSEFDPLIAESYFKEGVELATAGLKNQIAALQEQIDELRFKLDALEVKAGLTSTASRGQTTAKPSSGGTNTNPGPSTGGTSPETEPAENPSGGSSATGAKTGVITPSKGANLRTGPNATEYDVIRVLAKDTKVEILSSKNSWLEVKLSDSTKGWVSGDLIKID